MNTPDGNSAYNNKIQCENTMVKEQIKNTQQKLTKMWRQITAES